MYSHPLINSPIDKSPGELLSVITAVNTNHPVVMIPLNETTIALYGADSLEEGAVLIIYNVQFKLVQAAQKLKLYTSDAKLWRVEDKLLLAANRHLAVAPFRLAPQRLEPMLGSSLSIKNIDLDIKNEVTFIQSNGSTISKWQDNPPSPLKISKFKLAKSVTKQITNLTNEGLNNAAIPQIIIPQLIESKDIPSILWCLDNLKDIPEKLLVDLLSFCLRTSDKTSKPLENGNVNGKAPKTLENIQNEFLNKILNVSYTDIYLLSHLKMCLTFDEILRLFQYFIERLDVKENSEENSTKPDYQQLYQWASLLLDSHYQNYLLTQDSQVLKQLQKLNEILEYNVS